MGWANTRLTWSARPDQPPTSHIWTDKDGVYFIFFGFSGGSQISHFFVVYPPDPPDHVLITHPTRPSDSSSLSFWFHFSFTLPLPHSRSQSPFLSHFHLILVSQKQRKRRSEAHGAGEGRSKQTVVRSSLVVWLHRAPPHTARSEWVHPNPHPLNSGDLRWWPRSRPSSRYLSFFVDLRWYLSLFMVVFMVDAPLMELEWLGLVGFAMNFVVNIVYVGGLLCVDFAGWLLWICDWVFFL